MRSLGRAIEYEARRQVDLLEAGERVRQETRHWDEDDGRTHTLRIKEEADDYRYFPEPDLVPLAARRRVDRPRSGAALPAAAGRPPRRAWPTPPGVGPTEPAVAVAVERGQDDLAARRHRRRRRPGPRARPRRAQPGRRRRRARSTPAPLAALVALEVDGELTATQAKTVLAEMVADGGAATRPPSPPAKGFEAMDTGALEAVVDAGHRRATRATWAKFVAGDDKAAARRLFVGAVMKATKGQADGKAVTALLQRAEPAAERRRDARHFQYETVAFPYSDVVESLETIPTGIERVGERIRRGSPGRPASRPAPRRTSTSGAGGPWGCCA